MNLVHARNLDLNLLRIFVVVAAGGSVTRAAGQLYLTQSAVSAALRRLTDAVGAKLFVRQGRGITLTARGQHLFAEARPHLEALVAAALDRVAFDPATSDRTFRLGLADATSAWLLPGLLRELAARAPHMRVVVLPVQFRTVGDALTSRTVDMALSVADDLPQGIRRKPLGPSEFVCLFDARHARLKLPLRERDYFHRAHVVVSYNGDLRGIVEDALGRTRRVRCSVPSLGMVGDVIDGTDLIATVPAVVAEQERRRRPHLRVTALPFRLPTSGLELLWLEAADDDPAAAFLRDHVERLMVAALGRRRT